MKNKIIKYSFYTIIVILIGITFFAFREYNRTHKDVNQESAAFTVSSEEITGAFNSNEKEANKKYLDKIVSVKGTVKSIETDDLGSNTVVMGNTNSTLSVRCSLDSIYNDDAKKIKMGEQITVKGICTGFNSDELLGSDVLLNRCAISK